MTYTVTVHTSSSPKGWHNTGLPGHVYYEINDGTNSYYYGFQPQNGINVSADKVKSINLDSEVMQIPIDPVFFGYVCFNS